MPEHEEEKPGDETPEEKKRRPGQPSQNQLEEQEGAVNEETAGVMPDEFEEEAPEPPVDVPGPLSSVDRSDDESDSAKIAREAAEQAPSEKPLPETEDQMADLAPPEQTPPKEQGEPEPMVKPDVAVPESEAEVEETPEADETEHEAAEGLPEGEIEEKKPRPSKPTARKTAGLPSEEEAEQRWYVIHAHSGHENKVRSTLQNKVKQEQLEHLVAQIIVPTEEVAEVKGGKKRITSRKIFPGYVLVEMKLTHQTWYLIRTTSGVTGFIGSGKMPTPLEPEEVEAIFQQMRGEQKKPKPKVSFERDEKVKIIEGPFTNFMGFVDEVHPERGKLKVMVEIFERLTPVELEFWQVEKV